MASIYNPLESLFQYLANEYGFAIDEIRYVVLMFSGYPMALILRHLLHPSHTPLLVRYMYSLLLGVAVGLICFGWEQMAILFFIIVISYLLLLFTPPAHTQWYSMAWAMGAMAATHLYRIISDYGGYHLDFSGPLMIMVQKITLVAFALHDGKARLDSELSKDQREQKILTPPGPLEYFSYMFNFHSLLAGPSCTLREYQAFLDGSNLSPPSHDTSPRGEPSGIIPVLYKLFQAVLSVLMYVGLTKYVDNDIVMDPRHRQPFRLLLNYINSLRLRGRYYFIWLLGESVSNCAGLGFAGYDERGRAKWDLICNINIWEIECATNLRAIAIHWNAVSGLWLRRCVYDRAPFAPTLCTFAVSAWWHGFYPGYYFCFIHFGIATEAARKMRRLVRHHFQGNAVVRVFYTLITWLLTHIFIDYGVLCLDMMWTRNSIIYWSYYYYLPILSSIVVVFFFPSPKNHSRSSAKGLGETDIKTSAKEPPTLLATTKQIKCE